MDKIPQLDDIRRMRAIPCLIAFAASALVQIHPSLPEPGTLDGVGVNIYLSAPTLVY